MTARRLICPIATIATIAITTTMIATTAVAVAAPQHLLTKTLNVIPKAPANLNAHLDLPTLRSVQAIRRLSSLEASAPYPVLLKGVVTTFSGYRNSFFLQDATGGISVDRTENTDLHAGDEVEVTGHTGAGLFAPIIVTESTRVLGAGNLPTPRQLTYLQMEGGNEDSQWAEVQGIVRAASVEKKPGANVLLLLVDVGGGEIGIRVQEAPHEYEYLVDAEVRVRGVCGTRFNQKKQFVGLQMWTPDMRSVKVLQLASPDPFAMQAVAVRSILQFGHAPKLGHRTKLSGSVTYQDPGHSLYLQDGSDGILIKTQLDTPLALGTRVEAVGFPSPGEYSPVLEDSLVRVIGPGAVVLPVRTQADNVNIVEDTFAFAPYDGQLIQVQGEVVEKTTQANEWVWIVRDGKTIFEVHAKHDASFASLDGIQNGSRIAVTGICAVQVDAEHVSRSFVILLRSPRDVVVLSAASRWTAKRMRPVLTTAAAIMLLTLLWVLVLRRRVKEQTTAIRISEDRFRYLAQHDSLTGLANRLLLNDRLEVALARAKRYSSRLAVLLLDVDNFKQVNDSLGHQAGDRLLCVIAGQISALVRTTDTVARMGGDEFVVLLTDLADRSDADNIAAKIVATLSAPVGLDGNEVPVSVSAGVCVFPEGGVDAATLMQNADIAMYEAKAQGRNAYKFFTPTMASVTIDELAMQVALARALQVNEFELQYQPMVDFNTGMTIGFEALLRWRSKKFGLVMPDNFIPLAEKSGLIVPIGEWVLNEACRQIGQLEKMLNRSFILAVNVSPRQIEPGNLPAIIEQVLVRHGRAPGCLEVELTEGILMSDSPKARETLKRIREMGVHIAIDDFGIGFSSLSYIMRFAINRLKIDRSFIANCTCDRNSAAVARAIIAMAHGLNIEVVAEGVETPEHYAFLRREKCDVAQGYYLSRPIDAADLPAFLDSWGLTIRPQYRSRQAVSVSA